MQHREEAYGMVPGAEKNLNTITKAGGTRTDADLTAKIINNAPEEYKIEKQMAKKEVNNRTQANQDYLKHVLKIYQDGYKDIKKITGTDENNVSLYV